MGAVTQNLVFVASLAGAVATSQLPELSQQYRQRIGGAVSELSRAVAEFDRDAAEAGMSRVQAIDRHQASSEALFQARGKSAQRSIARLELLKHQETEFDRRSQTWQPMILGSADHELLEGAWRDFRPAVPVATAGLIWGGIGFAVVAFGWLVTAGILRLAFRRGRKGRERSVQ